VLDHNEFRQILRDALNHLWDPSHLQKSPLVQLLQLQDHVNSAAAARHLLIEAVESLEPEADQPAHAKAWRIYESLYYRYVQQLGQADIADQLGISPRQLRREQRDALEVLATRVWKQHDLGAQQASEDQPESGRIITPELDPSVQQELSWLKGTPTDTPTDPGEVLPTVIGLIQPLASQQGVELNAQVADDLPLLAADPVAVRQILLNLLGVAVSHARPGSVVTVSARAQRWEVDFAIRCTKRISMEPMAADENSTLGVAEELVRICGGKIQLSAPGDSMCATFSLPILEQLPVLAVDDNAHALQLFQRYTAGTRYRLTGTQNPEEAVPLAERIEPQVIILDVMMPRIDGWELLGRLRQHPAIGRVPIIVCTILAQEKLALSLGASGLLRKPVTRPEFLHALDAQTARNATESH
jgi:CheY-like chemotaxis protein